MNDNQIKHHNVDLSRGMRIPYLAGPAMASPLLRSVPESAGISPEQAAVVLEQFLSHSRVTTVLSGAGISVDSNIPDYRGIEQMCGHFFNRFG